MSSKVVLVTGCSSGIGRSLCLEYSRRGYRVTGTSRRADKPELLGEAGVTVERLDVNDALSAAKVVEEVLHREGRIDILVNNAGFGLFAPMLDLSDDDLAGQFNTNVFAPIRLAKLVAPAMKTQGSGLIVNIGSISGVVTTPFAGAYCGSKAALHAVTDALRMELAPFGIRVMSVQPGGIMSEFGNNSLRKTEQVLTTNSWYHSVAHSIKARARVSQAGAMPGELFAKRLVSLTERAIPPAIVRIGSKSFSLPFLKAVLPASLLDALLSKRFGLSDVVL